jgi:hypothetical protein
MCVAIHQGKLRQARFIPERHHKFSDRDRSSGDGDGLQGNKMVEARHLIGSHRSPSIEVTRQLEIAQLGCLL